MIDVKAEKDLVQLTFPTKGMSPDQINDFVTWLKVESIARRSKMTEETAMQLSEDLKADWWGRNKQRFGE
jgi:hypothetical protein